MCFSGSMISCGVGYCEKWRDKDAKNDVSTFIVWVLLICLA